MIPASIAGIVVLCLFSKAALDGARMGLTLWAGTIAPALLPFLILTRVMQDIGAMQWLGRPLKKLLSRVFNSPPEAAGIYLCAALSGYPVGSKLIGEAYAAKTLSRADAARLASFCMVTGPSFMVASVGIGMLGSADVGWRMLAAHHLSALLAGFVFCRLYNGKGQAQPALSPATGQKSAGVFMQALSGAGIALLAVGCTMGFFGAVIEVLNQSGILHTAARLIAVPMGWLGMPPALAQAALEGIIEMTSGCKTAADLGLPIATTAALSTALISFGGLSVQMQSLYFFNGAVSKRIYFAQRLLHACLSFALAQLIFLI